MTEKKSVAHTQMEHCNPAERKAWNKLKLEFRKTHPDLKHDAKYYQLVRALYRLETLGRWKSG